MDTAIPYANKLIRKYTDIEKYNKVSIKLYTQYFQKILCIFYEIYFTSYAIMHIAL